MRIRKGWVVQKGVMVPLADIAIDGKTQFRQTIVTDVVERYKELMEEGTTFPDIIIFVIGDRRVLVEGYHRYQAAKRAGREEINATVVSGETVTIRDAILEAVGANAKHGVPRSDRDRRMAVIRLMDDPEWGGKPIRWMAEAAGVSTGLVCKLARERRREDDEPSLFHPERRPRFDPFQGRTPNGEDGGAVAIAPPVVASPIRPGVTEKDFVRHLESRGQAVRTQVKTEVGIVPILTDEALYHFEEMLVPYKLTFAVGSLQLNGKAIGPRRLIVVYAAEGRTDSFELRPMIEAARQLGIEVRRWTGEDE